MKVEVNNDFATMAHELANRLQDVAMVFCEENGLDTSRFTLQRQHKCRHARCKSCWQTQMTSPLSQVARELLMFGGDAWPLAAFENA